MKRFFRCIHISKRRRQRFRPGGKSLPAAHKGLARRAALLLGTWLCCSLPGCSGLFFYPMKQHVLTPAELGLKYEDVRIKTADGTELHAWLLGAEGTQRGSIVFFHGNAQNISTHIASVYWLPAHGFNVLLADYRGYGLSSGSADLRGVHQDAEAVLAWIAARDDFRELPLAVLGQSLGGSIAVSALARSPHRCRVSGLVVESAFSGYRVIAREKMKELWIPPPLRMLFSLLFEDRFSPADVIEKISPIPLLFIYGNADDIVPMSHGLRLYRRAAEPKELWLINGGEHISAFGRPAYRTRLLEFLTALPEASGSC